MVQYSVLFVCLGNICRSPLGEGIFRQLLEDRGLADKIRVDSCGTGAWHIGEMPHEDSIRVAKKNGISIDNQRGRQLSGADFSNFDLLVAMDTQNQSDIQSLAPGGSANIVRLREYDPKPDSLDVPDPYWGGPEGFDVVFEIIHRSCQQLLDSIIEEQGF